MTALRKNLLCENRNSLEEVLPLNTPYTVAIDPCNLCNFRCKFCAMQVSKKPQSYKKQIMTFELFTKIIDDLTEFPDKLKILRISGQGEPLLNPNIIEMIEYAKNKNVSDTIEIVTNGSMLEPKLNRRLANSGVDKVRISIEGLSEEDYFKMADIKIDFNEFIANIRDLHQQSNGKCEICIKTVDAATSTEELENKFYNLFEEICDRIFIDKIVPLWSDFQQITNTFHIDEKRGMHGQEINKVRICPFPFYSFIINSEGEVTACCADWERKLVLGDVSKEKLADIWKGKKYREFLITMLQGNKQQYEMCNTCTLPNYNCSDNLDESASRVLNNMLNKFQ